MKKIQMFSSVLMLITLTLFSCEKESNKLNEESSNDGIVKREKNDSVENKSDSDFSYDINKIDLENELELLLDNTFNSNFLTDYPNASAKVKPSLAPNKYTITIQAGGSGSPVPPPTNRKVCEGSGFRFVKCVANWFEDHPNGCLVITQKNGTYYADDEGC